MKLNMNNYNAEHKELKVKGKYINRELSWLQFNNRVLYCANDKSIPLNERLKFLAISCSNLDEFIAVRYAGALYSKSEPVKDIRKGIQKAVEVAVEELKSQCISVQFSEEELKKYKYNADLLAYNLYGSVQLDFVILLLNDMYDPKEFTKKNVILPHSSTLSKFLNDVYSKEEGYIKQNRADYGILY